MSCHVTPCWFRKDSLECPTMLRFHRGSPRDHFQLRGFIFRRTTSNPDVEPAGLDYAFHVQVEKGKFIGRDRELDGLALAGFERHAFEIFQLHYGPRHGTDEIVNVQLHDFIAGALACVRYSHADFGFACRADLRRTYSQVRIFKSRVAKTEAEWKQRRL